MRIVQSPDEFVSSFLGAQREAAASFGINTILLEKYITQPRHIEVQVSMFPLKQAISYYSFPTIILCLIVVSYLILQEILPSHECLEFL